MIINNQWSQYIVFLNFWKKLLFSLLIPITIFLFCLIFIFNKYYKEIEQKKTAITLSQIRIKQHLSTLRNMPSITSLKALQYDYHITSSPLSANERLQQILNEHQFIPDSWEYDNNSFYKLRFTLSYPQFLRLLKYVSHIGFSLSSINVMPIDHQVLSVQLHLIDLNHAVASSLSLSEIS